MTALASAPAWPANLHFSSCQEPEPANTRRKFSSPADGAAAASSQLLTLLMRCMTPFVAAMSDVMMVAPPTNVT